MKFLVFIDYDNLVNTQKLAGILDVATRALLQTPFSYSIRRGTCDVRIYGGWFEGPTMTPLAQNLSVAIANDFPTIIRVPKEGGEVISLATTAELAVALMEEPDHHIFGTYRKKGKPGNVRVQNPVDVGCQDPTCALLLAKKLLKTGRCPMESCTITENDLVYRHEQKIVDTMLTCDMIYAPTQDYMHLILVSGDDDFLPPVRAVLRRGTPIARFHPRPNRHRTALSVRGTIFTDKDL